MHIHLAVYIDNPMNLQLMLKAPSTVYQIAVRVDSAISLQFVLIIP